MGTLHGMASHGQWNNTMLETLWDDRWLFALCTNRRTSQNNSSLKTGDMGTRGQVSTFSLRGRCFPSGCCDRLVECCVARKTLGQQTNPLPNIFWTSSLSARARRIGLVGSLVACVPLADLGGKGYKIVKRRSPAHHTLSLSLPH